MSDLSIGLKAGAVSGVIYGVVLLVTQEIISRLSGGYKLSYYVFTYAIPGAIYGLIFGIITGLIFGVSYKSIPGTTSMIKGIIFSIFAWLIVSFFRYTINYSHFYLSEHLQRTIMVDLIIFIFFGILLGIFWDKFGELERKCTKCQRVIPKDACLCPYCGENLEKLLNKKSKIKNLKE